MNGATISDDGRFRYRLWRETPAEPNHPTGTMTFVMLNPSVADAEQDDHTIRRCRFYAEREGCNRIEVINQFAYIATRPADLWRAGLIGDIVGPENRLHWHSVLTGSDLVVVAWGAQMGNRNPADPRRFMDPHAEVYCLGYTKDRHPYHPARLANDAPLLRWIP